MSATTTTTTTTRQRLLAVCAEDPGLTTNGVGSSAQQLRRLYGQRSDSLVAWQEQHNRYRTELTTDSTLALAEQVHDWLLANVGMNRTVGNGPSSYWVKHVVENAIGVYVSNGTLILAAVAAGYPVRRYGEPNLCLGMSMRDLRRLDTR